MTDDREDQPTTEDTEGHGSLKIDHNLAPGGDPLEQPEDTEGHSFYLKPDTNGAPGGDLLEKPESGKTRDSY